MYASMQAQSLSLVQLYATPRTVVARPVWDFSSKVLKWVAISFSCGYVYLSFKKKFQLETR